ncbi:MAG: hypothetical protein ACM35H_04520 [Bacteroidota bacterium]
MRWLFVAQDGWGLGHVSRQLGLARELRRLRPRDEMLFLTYSEATHVIAREGFASVKLPSSQPYLPREQMNIDPSLRVWIYGGMVNALMASYQPQAVVLDTFPLGLNGELAGMLRMQCARFLVAREVINPPPHWEYLDSLKQFHGLLAPYTKGEIALPIADAKNLHWVGPILIRGREDLLPREEARRRLGLPQDRRVCLLSFGGGGDTDYHRLEAWASELIGKFPDWHFALPIAPLRQDVPAALPATNASRFSYYPLIECHSAFDAAMSTTGSSAYELAVTGVPSILVPSVIRWQIEDHLQKARRIVGELGGFAVPAYDTAALEAAFSAMNDPARLAAMTADRAALKFQNGARTGAALLARYTEKIAAGSS